MIIRFHTSEIDGASFTENIGIPSFQLTICFIVETDFKGVIQSRVKVIFAPRVDVIIERCVQKLQRADFVHSLFETHRGDLLFSKIVGVSLGSVEES